MRLLPTLLLTLFGLGSAHAAKRVPPEDRFQTYHAKALAAAPIKLADASYRELTGTPRDYTVAVLLTALDPRYGCQLCREFGPEWELLARSWTGGDKKGESRVVFGTLDFAEGRDIFMSVSCSHVDWERRMDADARVIVEPANGPGAVPVPADRRSPRRCVARAYPL